MKYRKFKFVLLTLFLFLTMVLPITVLPAEFETKEITIHYLDQYNVPVKESKVISGEVGETLDFATENVPHFTLNKSRPTSYNITDEDNQNFTLYFNANKALTPNTNTYTSMFFHTAYTYTGFIGAEYGGNLAYSIRWMMKYSSQSTPHRLVSRIYEENY